MQSVAEIYSNAKPGPGDDESDGGTQDDDKENQENQRPREAPQKDLAGAAVDRGLHARMEGGARNRDAEFGRYILRTPKELTNADIENLEDGVNNLVDLAREHAKLRI